MLHAAGTVKSTGHLFCFGQNMTHDVEVKDVSQKHSLSWMQGTLNIQDLTLYINVTLITKTFNMQQKCVSWRCANQHAASKITNLLNIHVF